MSNISLTDEIEQEIQQKFAKHLEVISFLEMQKNVLHNGLLQVQAMVSAGADREEILSMLNCLSLVEKFNPTVKSAPQNIKLPTMSLNLDFYLKELAKSVNKSMSQAVQELLKMNQPSKDVLSCPISE